jgi:hypothetical protein
MTLTEIFTKIEDEASNILQNEYNNSELVIAIDKIEIEYIDDLFYTIKLRSYTTDKTTFTYSIPAICGLPKDISCFTEKDCYVIAVFAANVAVEIIDNGYEDDDSIEILTKSSKILC